MELIFICPKCWIPRWLLASVVVFWSGGVRCFESEKIEISMAVVGYSYMDADEGSLVIGPSFVGVYGLESKLEPEQGRLVHVLTEDGGNHACSPITNAPQEGRWIALVKRGGCKFHNKIFTAGKMHNASAVVVYNNIDSGAISMSHNVADIVSIFINKSDGERLVKLVDGGLIVNANITVGKRFTSWLNETQLTPYTRRNNTMLVTLLSFIGLLVLGLSALLVYAVRRSQYVHKMSRPRMVFTLQEGGQTQENLLPADIRRDASRHVTRPRQGPPPAWQPRWMPARTLTTIPEDQRSLEQL